MERSSQNSFSFEKNGSIVIHAITGKNTIGTARPGNSSGNGWLSGSVYEMGIITQAKDPMLYKKLNTITPRFLKSFRQRPKSNPARSETKMFTLTRLTTLTTDE